MTTIEDLIKDFSTVSFISGMVVSTGFYLVTTSENFLGFLAGIALIILSVATYFTSRYAVPSVIIKEIVDEVLKEMRGKNGK